MKENTLIKSGRYFTGKNAIYRLLKAAPFILGSVLFLIICYTFKDYGLTYDKPFHIAYGNKILIWYGSLFKNSSALTYGNLFLYGGFFDTIAALISIPVFLLISDSLVEIHHFINAIFGLLGIFWAYKLGKLLSGRLGGIISGIFLVLTPVYYGHMFNNPKDLPFAALFIMAVYYLILCYQSLPEIPGNIVIKTGIAIGLAMGIRVGGIILFIYAGFMLLLWVISRILLKEQPVFNGLMKIILKFSCIGLIAWLVMLVWWPWAQTSPVKNPFRALTEFGKFNWGGVTFFNGAVYNASDVPWSYIPGWYSIILPEFYFVAMGLGIFLAIRFFIDFKKTESRFMDFNQRALLVFAAVFPVIAAIAMKSSMYGSIRHSLFITPAVSVICGISVADFIKPRAGLWSGRVIIIIVSILTVLTMLDMYDLHPYQSVYFNRLFGGGLENASKKFETDYWGAGYKEGFEWLSRNYEPNNKRKIRVAMGPGNKHQMIYYLSHREWINRELAEIKSALLSGKRPENLPEYFDENNRFQRVDLKEKPEIYVSTTWLNAHEAAKGQVLYTVSRKNVPLLYVVRVY